MVPEFVDEERFSSLGACFRPKGSKLSLKLCDLNDLALSVLCRVLYGNKITELPKGLFDGLVSLQLL